MNSTPREVTALLHLVRETGEVNMFDKYKVLAVALAHTDEWCDGAPEYRDAIVWLYDASSPDYVHALQSMGPLARRQSDA